MGSNMDVIILTVFLNKKIEKFNIPVTKNSEKSDPVLINQIYYEISFNPSESCDSIKTKYDVGSITLSTTQETDNKQELTEHLQKITDHEIKQRQLDIIEIEKSRDEILKKLCDSTEINDKKLSKLNEEFQLYCMQIKKHSSEIEKLNAHLAKSYMNKRYVHMRLLLSEDVGIPLLGCHIKKKNLQYFGLLIMMLILLPG